MTIQVQDPQLADLRVVLEYKRSRRRRARSAGPILPPNCDDTRLNHAVRTAIEFAGHCAREAMAAEDKDFDSDDEEGDRDPKWGDTWDLSDLSDDMHECLYEEL